MKMIYEKSISYAKALVHSAPWMDCLMKKQRRQL